MDEANEPQAGIGGRVRWTVGPLALLAALLLPLLQADATGFRLVVVIAIELLFVCGALLFFSPSRFWWAGRIIAALIAIGYSWYFVDMLMNKPGSFWPPSRRSAASGFNSVLGFFALGYPGLKYALLGRFTWREKAEVADTEDDGVV